MSFDDSDDTTEAHERRIVRCRSCRAKIVRAIERHGGAAILERAFAGFAALPAPEQPFQVLGVGANASKEEVERAYRLLASAYHPDRGGDPQQMARINAARDALIGDAR